MTRIIFQDSYKYSHFKLNPPELQTITSYIEPRGPAGRKVQFSGLQALLKGDLSEPLTIGDVDDLESYIVPHGLPFNRQGFLDIINKFGGYMPLEIQALPEGLVHNTGIPQVQITNLGGKDFRWIPSFVETSTLRSVWYPSTVGSISWNAKQRMRVFLEETSDNVAAHLAFMLHDFGMRAASSHESAGLGGFGHLINFMGTDTTEALRVARRVYGEHMAGYSVIASEHSIATVWGPRREAEYASAVLDALEEASERTGYAIASIVADSYDLWNFIRQVIGETHKERIKKLEGRGRLVVRPDSGDPLVVPVKVVEMLGDIFGFTVNSKGYKVLPDYIRVIQGDGVNTDSIVGILENLKKLGWSAENIVFGMGGKLIGAPQRDDYKYAQKVNSATMDDEIIDIYKAPATDPGKSSKAGRQAVVETNGKLMAIPEAQLKPGQENWLKPVWRAGELLVDHKLSEMRERSLVAM